MGIETALIAGAVASGGAAILDSRSQKNAVKSAERQKAASQAYIEKQIAQARQDIFKLFPEAQKSRQQGLNAGLSLFNQAYPQMQNTFQQGNVQAQQALIGGLPQIQNSIMGRAVDLRGMQPVQLQQPQGLTMPNAQLAPIADGVGNA